MNSDERRDAWRKSCREDARSNTDLVGVVLSRRADPEDESYWEAVRLLHGRFDQEIFAQTQTWADSLDASLRRLAADVLSQADVGDEDFKSKVGELLVKMLEKETDPETLSSLAMALGHNGHPEGIPLLVKLRSHPDESVREGVAYGLGLAGTDAPEAISGLIELSNDPNSEVRDWATFALGQQTELDTPELREALWRRTSDADPEIQGEAVVGLALRKDPRVVPLIEALLSQPQPSHLVVEAAKEFPQSQFLPLLLGLDSTGKPDWMTSSLKEAIRACRPSDLRR